jgi:IS1 family transposase
MNQLGAQERTRIIAALVEGNSMRAVSRITGIARNTINKLLVDIGRACSKYQDKAFRNLACKRVQCDEIWSFVGAKEKNTSFEKKAEARDDVWTWVALCADSKLVLTWFVGSRDAAAAYHFMHDLKGRLANRVQLTTDGHGAYLYTVKDAFGSEIDYAQWVKIHGAAPEERRYSPVESMRARKAIIAGDPVYEHVSTSFVERQNLRMRMSMRRFAGLSNGFSRKVENHKHMMAVHYMYYNFSRIHQTLRVTPAMEAGVTDHVWSFSEIISFLDSN